MIREKRLVNRLATIAFASIVVAAGCQATSSSLAPSPTTASPPATPSATGATSSEPISGPTPPAASNAITGWRTVASMGMPRYGFDAVVLGDNKVLVVGSDDDCAPGGASPGSEKAELYDPVRDAWTGVASLNKPRKLPATVVLPDGSAMVLGGLNADDFPFSSTKIFAVSERSWSDGPLLQVARSVPYAANLPDGRVLVVSYSGTAGRQTTSEMFEPAQGRWAKTASLPTRTDVEAMIALTDGRVLVTGANRADTDYSPMASVYEPRHDEWTAVDPAAGFGYALVPLPDGGALALGGSDGGELAGGNGSVVAWAQRFDPRAGRWSDASSMAEARIGPQVAVLQDGRILVAGGSTWKTPGESESALRSAETYDPATDQWSPAGELSQPRKGGRTAVLADGSVLVMGGDHAFNTEGDVPFCPEPTTTVERFYPGR